MHRSLLLLTGFPIVLLSACQTFHAVSPEEVLQRSMEANAALSSASYTVRATYAQGDATTTVLLQGNFHRESQINAWRMHVEHNGVFTGAIVGIDVAPNDLYVQGPEDLPRWYHLRQRRQNHPTELALLPLPANLLAITKDHGQVWWEGRRVHQYDVVLRETTTDNFLDIMGNAPPLPMFRFTGALWIDAESFLLQRSTWDITTHQTNEIMKLDVSLKHHNAAHVVPVPASTEEWSSRTQESLQRIFDTIPPPLSLLLGVPEFAGAIQ